MAKFTDNQNQSWTITLDAPTIERVRKDLDGLDLADLEGKAIDAVQDDLVLLAALLSNLCAEQYEAQSLTPQAFAARLTGDAIDRAIAALVDAVADFFPSRKREVLRAVAAKGAALRRVHLETILAKVATPELEAQFRAALESRADAELTKLLTQLNSATSTPDSSVSARTD